MAATYVSNTAGDKFQSYENTVDGTANLNAMAKVSVDTDGKPINGRPYEVTVQLTPYTGGANTVSTVMCATQTISNLFAVAGVPAKITNATLIDEDDQVFGCVAYFPKTNVSFGSENASLSISDANAREMRRKLPFAQALADDMGGAKVWSLDYLDLTIFPESSSATDGYVMVYLKEAPSGNPTFTTNLYLHLTVVQ